jgi:hypothetical protein
MNAEAEYRDDLRPRPTRRSMHESLLVLAKGADLAIILNIGHCTCRYCVLCTDRGDICPNGGVAYLQGCNRGGTGRMDL